MTITLDGTKGETFPSWTTATRPSAPNAGQVGFNTTTGQLETYNGSAWIIDTAATTQGTSGQYLQSSGTGASPTWASVSGAGGTTASGSVVLTSSSASAQSITPTGYNQSVTLPDATTLSKGGNIFTIQNAGQYPIKILTSTGTKIGILYPYLTTNIGLADNSTATGVWLADSAVSDVGITSQKTFYTNSYNLISVNALSATKTLIVLQGTGISCLVYDSSTETYGSIVFANTTDNAAQVYIVNSTTALLATTNGTNIRFYVVSISGNTVSFGSATTITGTTLGTWSAFSTVYAFTYVPSSTWSVVGVSFSGTTITAGTPTAFSPSISSSGTTTTVVGTNCNAFVASGNTTYYSPFTVNTSTLAITLGTAQSTLINSGSSFNTTKYKILNVSADNWVIVTYGDTPSTAYYAIAFTTGSNAITKGTAVYIGDTPSVNLFIFPVDLCKVNATKFCFSNPTASGISVNIFTLSGTTITAGTVALVNTTVSDAKVGFSALNGTTAIFQAYSSSTGIFIYSVDCSGSSPVINSVYSLQNSQTGGTQVSSYFQTSFDGSTYYPNTVFNNSKKTYVPSTGQIQNLNSPVFTIPSQFVQVIPYPSSGYTLNSTEIWIYFSSYSGTKNITLYRLESST